MPPRFAVPDFLALSIDGTPATDAETVDAAKTIGSVLWDDLNFEREFALIPRDIISTIPPATSLADVPLDRWREVNADGVVIGTVQKMATGIRVEVRCTTCAAASRRSDASTPGSVASKRLFAHSISDELHFQQRALHGVARTKLTFNSDRDGERMAGTVENRGGKEIYIADYDGESQRRVTTQRSLNMNSTWSPDGRSIPYVSYRRGQPQILISNIYEGTLNELTKSGSGQNVMPVWSPDGTRIAFASTRDNNFEIYIANRDGSNVRRLTNHPPDITPTWSPTGTEIAFTSDRTGTPQIYVIGTDGLGLRQVTRESKADRPTWSAAPFNEIAYAASTGPGNDIKVLDLATGGIRQLTFGEGTNESPSFSQQRAAHCLHVYASGQDADFHDGARRQRPAPNHASGANFQPDWSKGQN